MIIGRKTLLDLCKEKIPDAIEMDSIALLLHSFYNGVEKILEFIFKDCKEKIAKNANTHKELLVKAFVSNTNRKQIFKNELQKPLEDYLGFRHFIRHSYYFQLEWPKIKNPVKEIENIWNKVKEDINAFINEPQIHDEIG